MSRFLVFQIAVMTVKAVSVCHHQFTTEYLGTSWAKGQEGFRSHLRLKLSSITQCVMQLTSLPSPWYMDCGIGDFVCVCVISNPDRPFHSELTCS